MLETIMRWARVRGLKEGPMQKGRVEALDDDARDDAQRPQDYGFAANPVEGEGLKLEIGGHTVIIRLDRMKDRPQLADYEVAVWHKEGHMVKLKAGRVIEISGDQLVANISGAIELNSASLKHNGVNVGSTHTHIEQGNGAPVSPPQ